MGRPALNRTCDLADCDRKHVARGLCSSHYNQTYPTKNRHAKSTVTCARCGTPVTKHKDGRRENRYCSYTCRDQARAWDGKTPSNSTALELWTAPIKPMCPKREPKPPTKPTWVNGPCGWCGQNFTTYSYISNQASYCSDWCRSKAGKARRRAREAGASGSYTWAEVVHKWRTINKCCAYCDQPTPLDTLEPDHVEPLSKGGSNSIANVVPSCGRCNGDKRDLYLYDWYLDRKRRGKPERHLHPVLAQALTSRTEAPVLVAPAA